jgi:threonine dehydratase
MNNNQVTLADIERAHGRIADVARRTPLERARWLAGESGREAWLKMECFQTTGSFKLRGAMSRLSALTESERARGVLTVSAGNHGLAVAHSASLLGIDATIVVPRTASRAKVEAIARYPVTLIERGESYDEAERAAREMERQGEKLFVSPYNDPYVIAGQGTVGLEVITDEPRLEAILVPTGGGGLLAGVAVAVKALMPHVEVYGVESTASPSMLRSLEAGRIVEIEEEESIADGLAGNIEQDSITFPIIKYLIDGIVLVSEDSIRRSITRMAREEHVMIEGAAAAGLAALDDDRFKDYRVAAIITGRNITLDLFRSVTSGK